MSTKIDDDTLYDVPGLAKMLGVTEKTIRRLLGNGALKGRNLEESGMSLVQSSKLILRKKNRLATRSDNFFFDCCKGGITAIEIA